MCEWISTLRGRKLSRSDLSGLQKSLISTNWQEVVFDALTGTIFTDDSQVVELLVGKWFGLPERVEIFIELAQRDMPLLVGNFQFAEIGQGS